MYNSTLWEYDLRYLNRKSIVTLDILFDSSFLLFLAITFPPVFPSHFSFFLKRNKEEEKSNVQSATYKYIYLIQLEQQLSGVSNYTNVTREEGREKEERNHAGHHVERY